MFYAREREKLTYDTGAYVYVYKSRWAEKFVARV